MRRRQQFLGRHLPGDSWLHRAPAGAVLAGVAGLSILVLVLRQPWLNTALILGLVIAGLSARAPLRDILMPVHRIRWIVLILLIFHCLLTDAWSAFRVISGLLVCVLAAGLLMLTATVAELLEVFERLATPLRILRIRPDRVGLTAALMVRSLPFLADLAWLAGTSAKARGLERDLRARTVPVVLGAVKYAQDTGRALDARGLGD